MPSRDGHGRLKIWATENERIRRYQFERNS